MRLSIRRVAARQRRRLPWLAIIVLGVMLVCAAFAPWIAPHSPTQLDLLDASKPPFRNAHNLLGTDTLGRDILSRMIFGARSSVIIGLISLSLSAAVGVFVGVISGFVGGTLDSVLMRVVDVMLAFPGILTALVIALYLGEGNTTVIVAVVVSMWAKFARMVRGEVNETRGRDFVTIARISGVRTPTIMARHILPNTLNTVMVLASLLLSEIILIQASLSFLGLGLPPGAPSWGVMVAEGRAVTTTIWWLSLFPGLAITIVVLAINVFGDWLRDTLDPRLRQA